MIKRMGFFTTLIIAGFFIFGSEVLGAGSCGITYNQNAGSLIFSGSALNSDYTYNIQILNKDDSPVFADRIVTSSSGGLGGSFPISSPGKYTFKIIDVASGVLCSSSVQVVIADNQKGPGQQCNFETDRCPNGYVCHASIADPSKYFCKTSPSAPDPVLLQEGGSCNPSTGPYCDSNKGLSCIFAGYVGGDPNNDSLFSCKKVDVPQSGNLTPFPEQFLSIPGLIKEIIKFSVGVAGVVAFFLLAVGSYKFMLSSGDPKALQSAQETISSAIAGLVLIVLAVALFGIISGILQIPGIDFDGSGGVVTNTDNVPE